MTKHNMTTTTPDRTPLRMPGTFLDRPLERLLGVIHEWQTRRSLERSLGHLSNSLLRDVGLTKADVEAACTDSFDLSASRALKSAAYNRIGNW